VTQQPLGEAEPDAWLVVIDMQNVFASPESPWATPGFGGALEKCRALAAAFGERVVFTRFVAPAQPAGAWRQYYEQWPFALVPESDPIYDLVDGLRHPGRAVVNRTTFSKWDDQPGSLRELTSAASGLVLAGVSTDCCVLSTALGAADSGVRVQVVADACAAPTARDHERALDVMRVYAPLIAVISTADVLRQLGA